MIVTSWIIIFLIIITAPCITQYFLIKNYTSDDELGILIRTCFIINFVYAIIVVILYHYNSFNTFFSGLETIFVIFGKMIGIYLLLALVMFTKYYGKLAKATFQVNNFSGIAVLILLMLSPTTQVMFGPFPATYEIGLGLTPESRIDGIYEVFATLDDTYSKGYIINTKTGAYEKFEDQKDIKYGFCEELENGNYVSSKEIKIDKYPFPEFKYNRFVYVTPTGHKFHKRNCKSIKNSDYIVRTPYETLNERYSPCQICNP